MRCSDIKFAEDSHSFFGSDIRSVLYGLGKRSPKKEAQA